MREHGFPTEHAGARCQRLILEGYRHGDGKTSLFRLGLRCVSVKAAAPESKQRTNPHDNTNGTRRVAGKARLTPQTILSNTILLYSHREYGSISMGIP